MIFVQKYRLRLIKGQIFYAKKEIPKFDDEMADTVEIEPLTTYSTETDLQK